MLSPGMVVAICIRLGSIGESVVTGCGVHGTTAVKWEKTSIHNDSTITVLIQYHVMHSTN